ncbi:related to Rho guanyl nucleotide exchange factor [Phialocephala subalpina]|uniref:Related to Rho guanyl nucleotide exchange factor n=1 Tax=Phialocephala subalpina TaxID=576137 RepID=A0A1L7XHQ0_9HELO|nr:related to Rho guanyl nucleotide exchange factor [Phialocephala subalpina]
MVRVTEELALSQDEVNLYYTTDPCLGHLPVLVFHGASTTTNSTLNSSRIQVHVFTAAGFQSYPRITISPNSPFYQSVNHLPRDRQGEEVCRGLAFGLLKYFKELPEVVKAGLIVQAASSKGKRPGSAPTLFCEQHAADLAASMVRVENIAEVVQDIEAALRPQSINHVDVDLVLPPGSIAPFQELDPDENMDEDEEALLDPTLKQYGEYAPLVKLFGEVAFLPTSKLRRAPSKANSLNRSRSFLKEQKMSLRREMSEFVDTEERYVMKMHELVNHIADDFRQKAKSRAFGSFSPSPDDLTKLFPKSLDRILAVNSAFLAEIKKVMDETEEDAMLDLEASVASSTGSRYGTGRLKDPTGALTFSRVLLEWFPQFSECYQEYMRASQEFPQIITLFVKQQSSFSQRVQQTGEQRLRSAVIEPVQRLPRYSLFIDNIVNFLPVLHPALQPMLKARDIITEICSLDPPVTDKEQVVHRLRNLVDNWPTALKPQGRLITAAEFVELPAPYHCPPPPGIAREGMFLLFADCVIILRKSRDCTISARGLMAEVDKPSAQSMMASIQANAGGQKKVFELVFTGWHPLGDTRFTMSDDGHVVSLASLHEMKDAGSGRNSTLSAATVRCFGLQGAYEAKALKFTEEVTKARVEGRFPESERETDKWYLRSIRLPAAEISLHTSVFEEGLDTLVKGRKEPAPIRIVVDHQKGTKGAPVGHYGIDIVCNVATLAADFKYKLETDGLHDRVFVDEVHIELFISTFVKRVNDLLRSQFHPSNPSMTVSFITFYSRILRAIPILREGDKSKTFRPGSPVKMLSSFLSGGFNSSTTSLHSSSYGSTSKHPRTPVLGSAPSMQPPTLSRTNSNKSTHSIQDVDLRGSQRAGERPTNPLVRLEETFTGYIAALQARKGNVVGRVLRNRATADELSINAVYNTFIENPFDQRTASEATVDILFVAFEKYLRLAWKDQMGPVMTASTLNELQDRALRLYPNDFAEYVKMVFAEMAPQNRRAFIAIIKLLADLLEGCGNDGDRGALTASFAELLVIDGEPHEYINLLDRMVEDQERLFDDIGPGAIHGYGTGNNSAFGSISGGRNNASATGSVASNTSSFRKRFADTLLRQNSKGDAERPSVWRTLSKTSRHVATGEVITPSSLSKGSINRSRSIEGSPRRPGSRDRPTVLGAFDERPSSSQGPATRLSTIGASPPPEEQKDTAKTLKKKRRSSLSDLKTLMAAATLANSPLSSDGRRGLKLNSSPKTPSPTKIPVAGGTPIMDRTRSAMYRTGSPIQKENTSVNGSTSRNVGNLTERPHNIQSDVVMIKDLWTTPKGHSKALSMSSNIPTLRGRTPSISRPTTSPGKPSSPQKLRLQSPQKLRERLQNEAKAINEAEASLQNELSKIGEEMAKLNTSSTVRSIDLTKLTTTVKSLESRIPAVIKDLTSRNDAVKADLEKSLQASEFKVKGLDQMYRESTAENELLYDRFNVELGKIVKAIRGKGKEDKEELVTKLKESNEEAARFKGRNNKLERELLTLRAIVKGNGA